MPESKAGRPVRLVDADVHPVMARADLHERLSPKWQPYVKRYGVRTPILTEFYPRARGAGMRTDSWPDAAGGAPGSDRQLLTTQLLDEYDVDYAVLNPLARQDCNDGPGLACELSAVHNDWIREEWLERDSRLLGAITVPHEYPELAAREVERCAADPRWVQVLMPTAAHDPLGTRRYWPIYEAAAAHGLAVTFHTGGYGTHLGAGWPSFYLEEHVGYALVMQAQLQSAICEGLFAAVPNLRLLLTEGGALWAASVGWALDSAWAQLRDEVPHLERRPSEYVHDHVWFTTQPMEEPDDPADFMRCVEHGRLAGRLVFATDYPHWDFDSPAQSLPNGLPAELKQDILAGNACRLYGLPTHREVSEAA
jgi:predicted TIM-barrel fold metal-dependent hydrolase